MKYASRPDLARTASATVVAELAFTRSSDGVDANVVTPLVDGDEVVIALPYSERDLAEAIASAETVALISSDARLTLSGWTPLAAVGQVRVEHDPDGRRFKERFIDAELRKFPPSRLLVDSLRDRRDNWWYLPRILCRLVDVRRIAPVTARHDPTSGVLAWRTPQALEIDTVAVEPHGDGRLRLHSLSGATLGGAGDPACLLRHDFSVPDLERRTTLIERGRLDGDVLRDSERDGSLTLPGPPGLLARVRHQRELARTCRREIGLARSRPSSDAP